MATIYPLMHMWANINISAVYLDIIYIANERRHTTIGDQCYVVSLKFNKVKYAMTTPIAN